MARSAPVSMESSGLKVCGSAIPRSLRRFVHEYYEEAFTVPPGRVLVVPISATTQPIINVTLSGEVDILLDVHFRIPPVTIAGPQPKAYRLRGAGPVHAFFVRFTTVGALALLGIEDFGITEQGAPKLHEVVRPDLRETTREWSARMMTTTSFAERARLTEEFLLARVRPPSTQVELLETAVNAIEQTHGNIRIGDLAREIGTSESTLRRHFRALGMSPKHFASIVRFRHAHAYLQTTPDATWADVVHRFGYSDQPHFVREYRRFSGGPPTQWQPGLRAIDRRMGIEEPVAVSD